MEKRIKTYNEAKSKHPERWSKNIRDWTLPEYVSLKPIKEEEFFKIINNQKMIKIKPYRDLEKRTIDMAKPTW